MVTTGGEGDSLSRPREECELRTDFDADGLAECQKTLPRGAFSSANSWFGGGASALATCVQLDNSCWGGELLRQPFSWQRWSGCWRRQQRPHLSASCTMIELHREAGTLCKGVRGRCPWPWASWSAEDAGAPSPGGLIRRPAQRRTRVFGVQALGVSD